MKLLALAALIAALLVAPSAAFADTFETNVLTVSPQPVFTDRGYLAEFSCDHGVTWEGSITIPAGQSSVEVVVPWNTSIIFRVQAEGTTKWCESEEHIVGLQPCDAVVVTAAE